MASYQPRTLDEFEQFIEDSVLLGDFTQNALDEDALIQNVNTAENPIVIEDSVDSDSEYDTPIQDTTTDNAFTIDNSDSDSEYDSSDSDSEVDAMHENLPSSLERAYGQLPPTIMYDRNFVGANMPAASMPAASVIDFSTSVADPLQQFLQTSARNAQAPDAPFLRQRSTFSPYRGQSNVYHTNPAFIPGRHASFDGLPPGHDFRIVPSIEDPDGSVRPYQGGQQAFMPFAEPADDAGYFFQHAATPSADDATVDFEAKKPSYGNLKYGYSDYTDDDSTYEPATTGPTTRSSSEEESDLPSLPTQPRPLNLQAFPPTEFTLPSIEADRTILHATSSSDSFGSPNGANTSATSFTNDNDTGIPGLHFTSLAAAVAHAANRSKPKIPNDDWVQMEANPGPYVRQIMLAFDAISTDTPRGYEEFDLPTITRWINFQTAHNVKVDNHMQKDTFSHEVAAWMVFGEIIDQHKRGICNYKGAEYRPSCSARYREVVRAIADYTIIRWDLIRQQRIEELVRDPVAFISRKMANFVGNGQKKKRDEENAAAAAEGGFDSYQPVLGTKRKSTGGAKSGNKKRKRSNVSNFAPENDTPETEESLDMPRPIKKARKSATSLRKTVAAGADDY